MKLSHRTCTYEEVLEPISDRTKLKEPYKYEKRRRRGTKMQDEIFTNQNKGNRQQDEQEQQKSNRDKKGNISNIRM